MNVAIVGYGRMGKEIEKILQGKNISTIKTIDPYAEGAQFKNLDSDSLKDIDVAIDFSFPENALKNIEIYIANNTSVVMGTTGWFDKIEQVKNMVGDKIGFIWSGNFSLGVNIFFKIVKETAKVFNNFTEYDPMIYEIHHNQKKDSPSGTAKMISELVLNELSYKKKAVEEKLDRKIDDEEIHIASIRGGSVPGTHVVAFDSPADTIELKHTVRNRTGLATGAVVAAEWIVGKKGFFSTDDLMNSII